MSAESPHEAILDACAVRLASLSLDGVEKRLYPREVIEQTFAVNVTLPGVVYGPGGLLEVLDELTDSRRDGWGYPVTMRVMDRHDAAQDPRKIGPHLKWFYRVRNAFHNKTLTTDFPGLEVVKGRLQAGVVVEQDLLAFDLVSLALVFVFKCVELRS